jgi:hypothetical protein
MIRTYRLSVFVSFFEFLFERFLLLIPMELAPPVSDVVLIIYSGLYIILYYYYYFVYSEIYLILFT